MVEKLDDTTLLTGSEAYSAALVFYNALKGAAKAGEPGDENCLCRFTITLPGTRTSCTGTFGQNQLKLASFISDLSGYSSNVRHRPW